MVTVEQVRQLETKVAKAIEYINKLTDENTLLKNKLDSYQTRIDELEVLIQRFKEDQGRIEEGILSALDRLNRFEDDVHRTITPVSAGGALPHPAHTSAPKSSVQVADSAADVEAKSYSVPSPIPAPPEGLDGDDSAVESLTPEDESASELDIF
ncbi:MAG: cell division protein ZapB [Spirochaetaceae bacterium]|jgi:FtsZ-binding cell division protein ZapB|nr:cell division protein ZapB [Spirochaetaceae bacterium]